MSAPSVAFISNYLNHHQLPFSKAMYALIGDGFHFIATSPISSERKKLGWSEPDTPFAVRAYESAAEKRRAMQIAFESDVVIIGSAPDCYISRRLKAGKLTFKYGERLYKKGIKLSNLLKVLLRTWQKHGRFQKYAPYMLCSSAYTAYDCSIFGNYVNRTYKWGYFPQVVSYDIDELMAKKNRSPKIRLLWVGRLLALKHPEASLELAAELKARGYDFQLDFIGGGVLEEKVRAFIREKQLEDCVNLLGLMSPEEVRRHMEEADIFLFNSDFNEGWGAVVNESMNSGCAVVASHAIGSVPFLLRSGKNGLIYRSGDTADLIEKVLTLMDSAELREKLGRNAYRTMAETWNAETAAERLLHLIEELQTQGKCELYSDGPCSRAELVKNDWLK